MPYATNADLPARIKKMFKSGAAQSIFRGAFNSVFQQTGDESKAFAIATAQAKKHMRKKAKMGIGIRSFLVEVEKLKITGNPGKSTSSQQMAAPVNHFTEKLPVRLSADNLKSSLGNGDLLIEGIALQEGTYQGVASPFPVFYSADVLSKVATKLVGKPLRLDHKDGVGDIVGKVVKAAYDHVRRAIVFAATVFDDKTKRLLKEDLVNSVSVGMQVDSMQGAAGMEAHSIDFEELSLVDKGACPTCKIKTVGGAAV